MNAHCELGEVRRGPDGFVSVIGDDEDFQDVLTLHLLPAPFDSIPVEPSDNVVFAVINDADCLVRSVRLELKVLNDLTHSEGLGNLWGRSGMCVGSQKERK